MKVIKDFLEKIYPLHIFIIFFIPILLFTSTDMRDINPASRFLAMESIVERGTFAITENHEYTIDKISIGNEIYSSKPPILTLIGAGLYYPLHNIFGFNFLTNEKEKYPDAINIPVYIITLILVGSSYIILLLYFYKTLNLFQIEKVYKTLLLFGIGFGTLYLPYATTLNNHLIAGSYLFVNFYYLLRIKFNQQENIKKNLIISGFLSGLTSVIDLPTGLTFSALFFLYYIITINKKYIPYYIIPTIPLLLLQLLLNWQITGNILPPQFHIELWNGPLEEPHNPFIYMLNIFFGSRGLFLYSPILLLSFYSIYKIIKEKNHNFRKEAIMIIIGFITISAFYIIKIRAYAGFSYGFRWFIAFTPLIYFFLIFIFTQKISDKLKNIFLIAMSISMIFAFIGLYNPWPNPQINIIIDEKVYIIDSPILVNIAAMTKSSD